MQYYVDLPRLEGDSQFIQAFNTKPEAVAFCQEHFGADAQGNVCLISEAKEEET